MRAYLQAARVARQRCIRNFGAGYRRGRECGIRNRRPVELAAHREGSGHRQRTAASGHLHVWTQLALRFTGIHTPVAQFGKARWVTVQLDAVRDDVEPLSARYAAALPVPDGL
jgi:hypothetical protein